MLQRLRHIVRIWILVKPLRTLRKMRKTKMVQYPDVLPLEAVQRFVEIVKSRTINDNKKEFGLVSWNVTGYLLRVLIGVPEEARTGPAFAHSGELHESLEQAHAAIIEFESQEQLYTAANPEEAGDIMTVITVLSVILNLLNQLGIFKRRKKDDEVAPEVEGA